ncbi:MAG TPA: Asp-tRNA(Asn)/Glu-tRNA(Gln) amidotransferase GatCAB subunit B, partial [Clostridiaceae bacterium]|nr:Asp-tRNA(Asn)/Glu-tRNA(Gln) amidotransferase GatCAB subunit B [Clostridiaceae bacterium]
YRYFPEPDLVAISISDEWIKEIGQSIPELPDDKKKRFIEQYKLPEYDADILTSSKKLADFFEECVKYTDDAKSV